MVLIGIIGKKSSGKSTIASHLVNHYKFEEYAFANALKNACVEIFGLSYNQVYSTYEKEVVDPYWNLTPRQILQDVGTIFRNMYIFNNKYKHIWIKSVERQIFNKPYNIVISDVRYQDEADMIKDKGGILLKVIRPNLISTDSHESEQSDIDADIIIYNEDDLNKLYKKIDIIYNTRLNRAVEA